MLIGGGPVNYAYSVWSKPLKKSKLQVSLLATLLLTTIVATAIAFWKNRDLAIRTSKLEVQMENIESDYLKRSRFVSLIGNLDINNENDLKTLKLAKAFTQHLSQIEKLGEKKASNVAALQKQSELVDVDDGGTLEILLLKTAMKFTPGWDQTIIGLYDDETFIAALPIETYTRTWHDVIIGDRDHDGIDDITIQEYSPGAPTAKRQITKETVYYVSRNGFTNKPVQIAE